MYACKPLGGVRQASSRIVPFVFAGAGYMRRRTAGSDCYCSLCMMTMGVGFCVFDGMLVRFLFEDIPSEGLIVST